MREWFLARLNAFLDNLLFWLFIAVVLGIIGAGVVAVLAIYDDAPAATIVTLAIVVFAAIEWSLYGLHRLAVDAGLNILPKRRVSQSRAYVRPKPPRIEYDGVEWEYASSTKYPRGPFCPVDHTPLAYLDHSRDDLVPQFQHERVRIGSTVGTSLHCLECRADYGKDWNEKTVQDSKREADNLFTEMEQRGEIPDVLL